MGGGLPPAPGVVRVREGYPPGVDAGGVTNASALAAAHRTALTNGSYRLSVEYREYVGGRPTGRVHEQTLVENATRYRSTVTTVGAFRGDAWAAANATTYADGERAYTRLTNETYADGTVILTESATAAESAGGDGWRSVAVTADRDRFASRTAGYLLWLLDDGDSTVVGSFERDGSGSASSPDRRRAPTPWAAFSSTNAASSGGFTTSTRTCPRTPRRSERSCPWR